MSEHKNTPQKNSAACFSLFNSYGTRVVVVALSFADVVVSATEESVFAVVVVVVVASLAAMKNRQLQALKPHQP